MKMKMPKWNIEEMCGYKPKTTFWEDFSIADNFGIDAVEDTYKRTFEEWKDCYVYLTELVMVLNHKIWQHYETYERLARFYNELWEKTDKYALDTLQGDELSYYFEITD